ncbi:hypothetical protein [Paenibacillus lacisoli]|uniref:hypothetical protein n=1 Tax=Paenibacillus lacisoli TaxID=3064525 RepID=UPI0031F2F5DF
MGDKRLKKGDQVVMHTCIEASDPKNAGRIWTCKTDEFTRGKGVYKQSSVFLEGYSGSFAPEFLQKVDLSEKEAEVKELLQEYEYSKKQAIFWNDKAVERKEENSRLRKALEDIQGLTAFDHTDLYWKGSEAVRIAREALRDTHKKGEE